MRNILALVGAATLTFLIVGWYLGWYEISGVPGPGGKQSVSVELHPDKVSKDVGRAVERGGEVVDSLRDKTKSDKPAPLTTPQGPASRFFGPEPAPATKPTSTNGWRPITPDR
jgi:hypothetical protein